MQFYDNIIKKREENKQLLEQSADESLLKDQNTIQIENEVDDAQTAVLYILEYFGLQVDRLYGFRSLSALLDTMLDPLGMMYEQINPVQEYSRKKTEIILAFRQDGKAVALMPTKTGYRYYCPSDKTKGYASKKYCASLQEQGYMFQRPLMEQKRIFPTFSRNIMRCLTCQDILQLLIATALTTFLGMFIPRISRWIYKNYIGSAEAAPKGFLLAIIIFFSVIIIRAMISMIKSLFLSRIKIRVSMEMQSAVMAKILHLPHSFFQSTDSGKLSKRVNSCSRLSDIILDIFFNVLLDLTFAVAYLIQLHELAPVLFFPAFLMILIQILVSVISALLNMTNETRLLEVDMEYTGFLYSAIRGIQKIKSLGAEVFVYSKWADMYRRKLSLNFKQPFFLKYSSEILSGISMFTTILILTVSLSNHLTSEDYMTYTSSYALIMTVVNSLTDIMKNLFLTRFLCRNVAPLFQAETEETESLEYIRRLRGRIQVEEIRHSYEEHECLKGISLNIAEGEKVALVGESGCGKSTLLKIIIGMIKPDSGNVFYDGKSILSMNQKSLRRCIGSVFQFSKLFPGTIAENIAFGHEDIATDQRIWEAADHAAIGDYIRSLPLKMETEISESNSSGFSGGQRQRILLARAFVHRPKVLILDEATSALDNTTQRAVLDYIRAADATVVMVAHRLSTVEDFDRIIFLKEGEIAEEGTYQELLARDGGFAELVRKQLL